MSQKYASYHIRTDEKSDVFAELKNIIVNENANTNAMLAMQAFSDPEARKMAERFYNLSQNDIYIVLTEKFISVYDETFSFQTINGTAKKVSKKIIKPIVYVSNFDDDVFLAGVVKCGKTYAKKQIGQGMHIFGIKSINDIRKIHNFEEFGYLKPDLIFELSDDICECEDSIEKELGITLKLTPEDIQEQSDQFVLLETESQFKVYQTK